MQGRDSVGGWKTKQVAQFQKKSRAVLPTANSHPHAGAALVVLWSQAGCEGRAVPMLLASLVRACSLLSPEKRDLGLSPQKNNGETRLQQSRAPDSVC